MYKIFIAHWWCISIVKNIGVYKNKNAPLKNSSSHCASKRLVLTWWQVLSICTWLLGSISLQVILFEIDCAIFYTNLHELFCQFISWTNWANSGKFMDNCWISCQVMADMKKVYNDVAFMNLYHSMKQRFE